MSVNPQDALNPPQSLPDMSAQYQQQLDEDTKALQNLPGQFQAQPFDPSAAMAPKPGEPQRGYGIMSVAPYLIGLSALGGKVAGLHAKTMLGATNGMVKGLIQGSDQAYKDSKARYDQAYQQWLDQFNQQKKIYDEMRQVYKGRVDADLRALEFARKATGDAHKVTQDDVKNWYESQRIANDFKKTNEQVNHDRAMEEIDRTKAEAAKQKAAAAQGGMQGREAVFFNRVTAAGNEAAQAAENIMELPIESSRGWFGSAEPGKGLLDSAKSVLANKATSQEVQTYKTLIAGVRRNLAAIESSGLAPSGALSEQMSAVEIQEGDTYLTKLRKMAELRQIVEKGLEPNLSNPRIPPEQKQVVQGIIDKIDQAIPFTQHDVTALEQSKNPQLTIRDVMHSTGVVPPAGAGGTASGGPPVQDKRTLDGKNYVKVNGQWYEDTGNAAATGQ